MARHRLYALIASVICTLAAVAQSIYDGKRGAEIISEMRNSGAPVAYVTADVTAEGLWAWFRQCEATADGSVRNRFSAARAAFPADGISIPEGFGAMAIAPWQWWSKSALQAPAALDLDMHNLVAAPIEAISAKAGHIPTLGKIAYPIIENDYWAIGSGYLPYFDEVATDLYVAPRGYEGDFARTLMYMIALYPCQMWQLVATPLLADGDRWPFFTAYGLEVLMQWHRSDPVDDYERQRNAVIRQAQGNDNPFVLYPDLAEYVWGAKQGEVFEAPIVEPETPETPDEPDVPAEPTRQPVLLKATYSISADVYLDFCSPYAGAEAVWSLDGKTVSAEYVELQSLAVGKHQVSWSSPTNRGRVCIMVTN